MQQNKHKQQKACAINSDITNICNNNCSLYNVLPISNSVVKKPRLPYKNYCNLINQTKQNKIIK